MPRTTRSLATPITLMSVAVVLSLGLLVGWTLLIIDTLTTGTTWLLILGIVSIAFITTVLLMSGIALAREIVEGRHQRNFVDSVTHELKSPLASLGLCLETLARPELSQEQRVEIRTMMRHDVDRLSAFIDGVLAASRVAHRKRGERNVEPIVLSDLVEEALGKVLRRHPDASPESVRIDLPHGLVVHTDELALMTILENLLDNALKYSPSPAGITLTAATQGDALRVVVADQGIGIGPRDLERIFRRFYRGDSDEVRARSGTGLGLHVAVELARGIGGRLEANSVGVGRGSTFVLTMPIGAPDPASPFAGRAPDDEKGSP